MTLDNWQQWEGRVVGGRYTLQQYLGGSDHSAVYLTDFGGARAIVKLVSADWADALAQLSRWEAACNQAHPNLLRVYETGRWHADGEQDMFFAVMECADENLSEVLSERALNATEVRDLLAPTLAALEYLHGRNLVHGCLKPSNVLAVGPQLKLAVDGVRRAGTRLISVEQEDWRAVPEVFNTGASSRNDIWALGLLLVEAFTRQGPKLDANGDGRSQLSDDIPEPFRSIAQACLQRDPSKRCAIEEIRHMLERPNEVTKAPAQVVPIRPDSALAPKPSTDGSSSSQGCSTAEATIGAPKVEESVSIPMATLQRPANVQPRSESTREAYSTQHSDLHALLDEAPSRQINRKLVVLAVAVLFAVIAVFAIVRVFGERKPEARPQAEAIEQPATPTNVRPAPSTAANPVVKPASAGVAHEVMPEVSRAAQSSIHGVVKVKVKVNVNESGEVTLAGIAAHGPSRYFAKQALEAARQWTFTPPMMDGKAVASHWSIEFDFRRSGVKAESRLVQPKA